MLGEPLSRAGAPPGGGTPLFRRWCHPWPGRNAARQCSARAPKYKDLPVARSATASAIQVSSARSMPLRRRSWVTGRFSMKLPHSSSSKKTRPEPPARTRPHQPPAPAGRPPCRRPGRPGPLATRLRHPQRRRRAGQRWAAGRRGWAQRQLRPCSGGRVPLSTPGHSGQRAAGRRDDPPRGRPREVMTTGLRDCGVG